MRNALSFFLALFVGSAPAHGGTNINLINRYIYSSNAGWIDLRPSVGDGVQVTETFWAGWGYGANFGWINFGDGSPANGYSYANSSVADFGVNVAADGTLTGFAYAANIGWIAFEQIHGKPRVDFSSGNFSGSIYSANLGWISLNTPSSTLLSKIDYPDSDLDGIGDAWEYRYFGSIAVATAISDFDGDGQSDLAEHLAGSVPNNANSYLRIVSQNLNLGLSENTLTFTTSPGRVYRLETSSVLGGVWQDSGLGLLQPDVGLFTTRTIHFNAGPKQFFRAAGLRPLEF